MAATVTANRHFEYTCRAGVVLKCRVRSSRTLLLAARPKLDVRRAEALASVSWGRVRLGRGERSLICSIPRGMRLNFLREHPRTLVSINQVRAKLICSTNGEAFETRFPSLRNTLQEDTEFKAEHDWESRIPWGTRQALMFLQKSRFSASSACKSQPSDYFYSHSSRVRTYPRGTKQSPLLAPISNSNSLLGNYCLLALVEDCLFSFMLEP